MVNSNIGLIPGLALEFNGSIIDQDISLGGEMTFNTTSDSFTKFNVGVSFNKPGLSAALILLDKGQSIKASYFQSLNSSTAVTAEIIHSFSGDENSFMIGGSHLIGPSALVKTRLSHDGKVGMFCQRKWRPKFRLTLSAEYDTKAVNSSSKFGVALALKP